jgi:hypothetical protein
MSQMGQCEMWLARDQVKAACIRDHVEPHGDDLPCHTLAHRAQLINTIPHGATRMAIHATVDTTRSHAGAPVCVGLRLINA